MNFDNESKSLFFCLFVSAGGWERGYASKVVDIKRMTKILTQDFLIFLFLLGDGGAWGPGAGQKGRQGRPSGDVGRGV